MSKLTRRYIIRSGKWMSRKNPKKNQDGHVIIHQQEKPRLYTE